jgi:hypothetical protein
MSVLNFYRLRQGITGAFTQSSLQMALDEELNKDLGDLVQPGSFDEIVYRLLKLADREDWMESLLKALAKRSNNRQLGQEIDEAIAAIEAPGKTVRLPDRDPQVAKLSPYSPGMVAAVFVTLLAAAAIIAYLAIKRDPGTLEIATKGFGPLDAPSVTYRSRASNEEVSVVGQEGIFRVPIADLNRERPVEVERVKKAGAKLTIKTLNLESDPLESVNVTYRSAAQKKLVPAEFDRPGTYTILLSDIDRDSAISLSLDKSTEEVQRVDQTLELKRLNYKSDPTTLLLYIEPIDTGGSTQ